MNRFPRAGQFTSNICHVDMASKLLKNQASNCINPIDPKTLALDRLHEWAQAFNLTEDVFYDLNPQPLKNVAACNPHSRVAKRRPPTQLCSDKQTLPSGYQCDAQLFA